MVADVTVITGSLILVIVRIWGEGELGNGVLNRRVGGVIWGTPGKENSDGKY